MTKAHIINHYKTPYPTELQIEEIFGLKDYPYRLQLNCG